MEFMKMISSQQLRKKLTDADVSVNSGISEYNYYNLKNYRTYLTKVGYYALCCVFSIPVGTTEEIDNILKENRLKVGTEESNLHVASEYVNFEYATNLEKELVSLQEDTKRIKKKDAVINKLQRELENITKELYELRIGLDRRVSEAYSNGVKEGSTKISNMKQANYSLFIDEINKEYTAKISKLEVALKMLESSYYTLYKGIESGAICSDNLYSVPKPLKLYKEQLGMEISEDIIKDVLNLYYEKKEDVSDIALIHNLNVGLIQKIIVQYKLKKEKGVYYIEKSK